MRLVVRIVGTWLIALATILLVIDGTKSLGASHLVTTSLLDSWSTLNPSSLETVRQFLTSRFFGAILQPLFDWLIEQPGFAVLGVPGIMLVLAGRPRHTRRYVTTDSI